MPPGSVREALGDAFDLRRECGRLLGSRMTSGRSLLLIADIGGYTEYMRSHRMSLAHAEVNTARLLEKVIDAVPRVRPDRDRR